MPSLDETVRERLGLPAPAPFDDRTEGILEGIGEYAWMRDGVYYVGTTGTTLREARRRVLDARGFEGVPDPYYAKLLR